MYDKSYYDEKKKKLGERLIRYKDDFINKIFIAVRELAKEQSDIQSDYNDIIKAENEAKKGEPQQEEKKPNK